MGLIPTFLVAYKIAKELEWEYKQILPIPIAIINEKIPPTKKRKGRLFNFSPPIKQ